MPDTPILTNRKYGIKLIAKNEKNFLYFLRPKIKVPSILCQSVWAPQQLWEYAKGIF